MNCIIVDDEPLAREAVEMLLSEESQLKLVGSFNSALAAAQFMLNQSVDLAFLDINMPGMTGLEFAQSIAPQTLVIFTTAYSEYAFDSYNLDAIDFLVKPIEKARFAKAVQKAAAYHALLTQSQKQDLRQGGDSYFFVKADRRYFKINFSDILFVEGLKDYVIVQTTTGRTITKMNLKNISGILQPPQFLRVSKSYIVNTDRINSFDNNDIYIGEHEIAIGDCYRESFFEQFFPKGIKG